MSRKILIFLYNDKIEKFDTSILESNCGINSSSHYKVLSRLEKIGIIKKNKIASHNKNIYVIIDKEKLEQLIKQIAEKL
jgi:predicted transcriptional regulator